MYVVARGVAVSLSFLVSKPWLAKKRYRRAFYAESSGRMMRRGDELGYVSVFGLLTPYTRGPFYGVVENYRRFSRFAKTELRVPVPFRTWGETAARRYEGIDCRMMVFPFGAVAVVFQGACDSAEGAIEFARGETTIRGSRLADEMSRVALVAACELTEYQVWDMIEESPMKRFACVCVVGGEGDPSIPEELRTNRNVANRAGDEILLSKSAAYARVSGSARDRRRVRTALVSVLALSAAQRAVLEDCQRMFDGAANPYFGREVIRTLFSCLFPPVVSAGMARKFPRKAYAACSQKLRKLFDESAPRVVSEVLSAHGDGCRDTLSSVLALASRHARSIKEIFTNLN